MENPVELKEHKNYWWIPLLSGIILLFFGIWFFTAPRESFQSLTIVFGSIILFSGVFEIYMALKNRALVMDYLAYLWGGLINVFLGIVLILNPKTILIIISILIGFWLIFKAGEMIKKALAQKKANNPKWINGLIFGLVLILLAIILIWHPDIIGFTIALWTSLAFIFMGVFRIYLAFRLKEIG